MKNLIRKLHLIIGLTAGIVIFIVATTGCITSFEEELRAYFYADLYEIKQEFKSSKKLDEILSIASEFNKKEDVKGIRIKKDPTQSVEVQFHDKSSVFINPYSGKILGAHKKNDDFFGKVLRIHRNLYLDDTGEWITGISCLLFLIMIISGIIIWWPKDKRYRKEKFTLKSGVHWKKLNYNLHNVLGFYAAWFILFTVLTGLIFSFEWAENGLYWATSSNKAPKMEVKSVSTESDSLTPLANLYTIAQNKFPEYEECLIALPEEKKESIRLTVRYGKKGFLKKQDNMFFDQYDGKILATKLFKDLPTGTKMRITNENIHTGKAFGIVGQWAVFFASLICASLPITGFLIWRNKRKKK